MITTNLLEFVKRLNALGPVRVKDHIDTIEVHVPKAIDVQALDDLVCDALFADPLRRVEDGLRWSVHLLKRGNLRKPSDLDQMNGSEYVLLPVA